MPNIRVFERDPTPDARSSLGYSFTLEDEGEAKSGGLRVMFPALQYMNARAIRSLPLVEDPLPQTRHARAASWVHV